MNEYDVQWVGESDWQFKVSFSTTKEELDLPSHDLVLDGLDTFCRVELVSSPSLQSLLIWDLTSFHNFDLSQNGEKILLSTNMFLSHRIPIPKKLLKNAGEANELKFFFESAWLRGKKEEAENGGPMGLCESFSDFVVVVLDRADFLFFWI